MKVAVVGAGICGLSAARTLCSRNHHVVLYEQFELFHNRGSSHGESRIVRRAYPDAFYTACMAEAYPLWHELEVESCRELLHECGLLYFGKRDAPNLVDVSGSLKALDVPFEILDASQAQRLLPQLRLEADEIAVWTPEAGWVEAASALRAIYELACAEGLTTKFGSEVDPIKLAQEFDVVIVAAGAWTRRFVPIPVEVTLQTFAYVEANVTGPVWIEDSFDSAYGFPASSAGQKMGVHRGGYPLDPESPERKPDEEFLDIIRRTAEKRFGIENPTLKDAKGCLYTTTKNEDFLLGRLAPNVFFASACSGHGFKMGPWIGRLLADFAEGKDKPERHERFYWEGG